MAQVEAAGRHRGLIEEIVDELPDGVVVVDGQGRIVFANGRLEALSGRPRSDLIGAPLETLVPKRLRGDHQVHRRSYQSAPRARAMGANLETVLLRRDGTEIPVDIALTPDRSGRFVISTIRDARERRQLESRLRLVEERERIARELQESVVHSLFALGLEMQALGGLVDDDHVSRRIDACIAAVDESIVQLRERVFNLRALRGR